MENSSGSRQNLRVALEGCGHGTLHEIYSSVQKAVETKGWDGVDLLIIGGDFQAVRNSNDLVCMNVPAKYKQIGDFHEYYSGARLAPFLTIFIGGNHEASNHLFELYYGGWVAPNIYYMGAANVLRFGGLRIAGLSGIWKGYDYQKQHFERLPYNYDDLKSIYHVRELDVRKLLQLRSQVDVGLSHDWPQGIEWTGNYRQLFRFKPDFEADANSGKLGSIAAKYVLDRLRPPFWFSAHLHCKYTGLLKHGDYVAPTVRARRGPPALEDRAWYQAQKLAADQNTPPTEEKATVAPDVPTVEAQKATEVEQKMDVQPPTAPAQDRTAKLSAWNNFFAVAAKEEAADNARRMKENTEYQQKLAAGTIKAPEINYEQTWRKVDADEGLNRKVTGVKKSGFENGDVAATVTAGVGQEKKDAAADQVKNADEIDLDAVMSDASDTQGQGVSVTEGVAIPNTDGPADIEEKSTEVKNADEIDLDADMSDAWSGKQKEEIAAKDSTVAKDAASEESKGGSAVVKNADEIDLDAEMADASNDQKMEKVVETDAVLSKETASEEPKADSSEIPQDIREQLPDSFKKPVPEEPPVDTREFDTELPAAITNTETKFLALDKCLANRQFIQLMELSPLSNDEAPKDRPFKLEYDKEWLAITRALADELVLGGEPEARNPQHKGDGVYKPAIAEAEAWVEENIVKAGKMTVPENFTRTAPVYDPSIPVNTRDSPPEYTNPQTAAFCELVGIENKFALSEEEKKARMDAGPRAEKPRFDGRRGGRGGGFSRGGGHRGGRGGGWNASRGGRGGWRGRGRGGRGLY